jgi:copper chaperone CopZ
MKKVISIEGMTCNHCKANVEKALKSVAGVSEVNVSLFLKQAELEIAETTDLTKLEIAVIDAGYKVVK